MNSQQITGFLLSISLMLLTAKIMGEIFSKLKQPAVVGEILGGIILGPTILGLLLPDFFLFLFPPDPAFRSALDGIVTLAVIMLLLVSGLEVDLSMVIKQGKTAVYTGVLGIIVPFALGFIFAYSFPELMGNNQPERKLIFSLFIGTAMSISALPVIAKSLMDLKIFKTEIGFIIISAAMFNDIIGWLIFSIIIGMIGVGASNMSFGYTVMWLIIFIVVVLFIGRKVFNRMLPWIQTKISFPGGVLNFILITGFIGAAITEYIGVHAIFGAFIVGIAIGESVHLKERTREVINQFVTNIFAPLFFVSIGLKVNFIENFNLPLVSIMLVLAFAGKVVGCSYGAYRSGLSKNESLAVGFGMNSRGAMEIILGILALQSGLINEEVFVALVILALVTSLVSAPMMSYFLRGKRKSHTLSNIINPDNIIYTSSNSKEEIIRELINTALKDSNYNNEEIINSVLGREKINSSGISNYLAVPHAKVKINKPLAAIGISKAGIDFENLDNTPAKVIVLLLTPIGKDELQLQILADIAKKFKDKVKVEQMLADGTKESLIKELGIGV